jgi:hypothetical protein
MQHLLTGMLREADSTAAKILQQFGVERETILEKLKQAGTEPE